VFEEVPIDDGRFGERELRRAAGHVQESTALASIGRCGGG
jgi:hypothetical protein